MREVLRRIYTLTLDIGWGGVILLLPISSLPLLSRLAGGTMVAPASFIPLVWLAIAWFVPYILRKGTLPREGLPLLLFATLAVVSSVYAFFIEIPPYKGQSQFREEFSAILTLVIGIAFYLVTVAWLNSQSKLHGTLKFINLSGLILLAWSFLQTFYIFFGDGQYPSLMHQIQSVLSARGLFTAGGLYPTRATGFAFEPSWLAHQINLLFLPFWLAATITGTSAHKYRLGKVSVENVLLVIGIGVIFLSSRIGTLAFLLILAFLGIYYNLLLAQRLQKWSLARFVRFPPLFQKTFRSLLPVVILLVFLGTYALGVLGLIYGLSHVDWRLARFFEVKSAGGWKLLLADKYYLFNYLAFAERFVYWVAGWNVFDAHPLFGVGLGNAGFFFQQALPAYSWGLPEVMDVYYRASAIPNIKSFWVRLLAETGVVGFAAFLSWFYVLYRSSRFLKSASEPLFRTIGWAGLFVLIAFLVEGFSLDTFALPYLWVSLGIVSAASAMFRQQAAPHPPLSPHFDPPLSPHF